MRPKLTTPCLVGMATYTTSKLRKMLAHNRAILAAQTTQWGRDSTLDIIRAIEAELARRS